MTYLTSIKQYIVSLDTLLLKSGVDNSKKQEDSIKRVYFVTEDA